MPQDYLLEVTSLSARTTNVQKEVYGKILEYFTKQCVIDKGRNLRKNITFCGRLSFIRQLISRRGAKAQFYGGIEALINLYFAIEMQVYEKLIIKGLYFS